MHSPPDGAHGGGGGKGGESSGCRGGAGGAAGVGGDRASGTSTTTSFSASIQLLGQSHSALSAQLATRGRHCAKYLWRLR